jgi:hypothetical protein
MLSWLFPIELATSEQREWVDRRFAWLIGQFGEPMMRKCPAVLPLVDYFPDRFEGQAGDVQR